MLVLGRVISQERLDASAWQVSVRKHRQVIEAQHEILVGHWRLPVNLHLVRDGLQAVFEGFGLLCGKCIVVRLEERFGLLRQTTRKGQGPCGKARLLAGNLVDDMRFLLDIGKGIGKEFFFDGTAWHVKCVMALPKRFDLLIRDDALFFDMRNEVVVELRVAVLHGVERFMVEGPAERLLALPVEVQGILLAFAMQGLRPIKIANVQLKFLFGKDDEVTLLLREFSFRDKATFFNLMPQRLMVRAREEFDLAVIEFVCLE